MKERNLFLNKIHLQFNSCNMGRYSFTHPWTKILYTNTHTKLLLVRRKQKEKQKGKKRQKILYHSCFIPGKKKSSNIILPTSVARWNTYLFTASQKKKEKENFVKYNFTGVDLCETIRIYLRILPIHIRNTCILLLHIHQIHIKTTVLVSQETRKPKARKREKEK